MMGGCGSRLVLGCPRRRWQHHCLGCLGIRWWVDPHRRWWRTRLRCPAHKPLRMRLIRRVQDRLP
jgi:hypothetical protein